MCDVLKIPTKSGEETIFFTEEWLNLWENRYYCVMAANVFEKKLAL